MWGRTIGAVSMLEGRDYAAFQYDPQFARSGIQISPLALPLGDRVYVFPELSRQTFHGLPGLLADSLPDRFGNALIDAWLATRGRTPESFTAVERLCYTGARGMGALEFAPALGPKAKKATRIEVDELVRLASEVLTQRGALTGGSGRAAREGTLKDILQVGTSAGGARAKAVIAWNRKTHEVRSGQVPAGDGFEYWLLKFDGVAGNKDKELEDPKGYGAIEYAYHLMARAAGIAMTECRLLEENGRRHFMTRRFDRLAGGEKLHMLSLGALAHFDFNQPGAHAYEQALLTIRQLSLPMAAVEERVPPDGVQHRRPQPRRSRQEHRLPDGQAGPLVAGARVRRDLQLQPARGLDGDASDDPERQARWFHDGRFSRVREGRGDEAGPRRRHRRRNRGRGRALARIRGPGQSRRRVAGPDQEQSSIVVRALMQRIEPRSSTLIQFGPCRDSIPPTCITSDLCRCREAIPICPTRALSTPLRCVRQCTLFRQEFSGTLPVTMLSGPFPEAVRSSRSGWTRTFGSISILPFTRGTTPPHGEAM